MFEFAVFWIFAAILVIAAGCVITLRNPVHSALFLVLSLGGRYFGIAALPGTGDPGPGASNTKELGRVLYTDYAYPFELAAVLLLVAIVVAIALTLRKRKDTKYQDPARQAAVKRGDRVRLVSMPSEKND